MAIFFNALLSAEFPQLCFVGGLILLMVAIFCPKVVRIGPVSLPGIDKLGRALACVFGSMLITVPVLSFYWGTTIGLVGPSQPRPLISPEKQGFWSIPRAFAQQQGKLFQTINSVEERITRLANDIGDGELYLYIGDVHLRRPIDLIIFRSRTEYLTHFKEGQKIESKNIASRLRRDDIVVEAKVKEGVETFFDYQGKRFRLRVSKVVWNIFGSGSMEIEISAA